MDSIPLLGPYGAIIALTTLCYVPHALKAAAVGAKNKASGKKGPAYDLKNPRASVTQASDSTPEGQYIARLQNGLAILSAVQAGVDARTVAGLSTLMVGARVAYIGFYAYGTRLNVALLRSTAWLVVMGASLALMVAAVRKA